MVILRESIKQSYDNFNYLRVFDVNIPKQINFSYGLRKIRGVGVRLANIVRKKLKNCLNSKFDILNKEKYNTIIDILSEKAESNLPKWLLNRRSDYVTGNCIHAVATILDESLKTDLDRFIKIKSNRGLRHFRHLKVRGQHTKSTGRKGKSIGVVRKKK
mmetsp:Transcript_14287/g.19884  ORF Transcript_14287/g.19884 Transcript_14287/m.19884 type:complete len:159 (-) Transcript_14287:200-676(-)